ncbi:MAG: type II toxin-antitoxin system ParD family antitoxin [Pseudomonadota bacterium]
MGMNIKLTPQLEEMVRQKVVSGLYNSASEVILDALRLMAERDQVRNAQLVQLKQDIQEGIDSGPGTDWDPDEVNRAGHARLTTKAAGGV